MKFGYIKNLYLLSLLVVSSCTWPSLPDVSTSRMSLGNPLGLTEDKAFYTKYDSRRVPPENFQMIQKQKKNKSQNGGLRVEDNKFLGDANAPSFYNDDNEYLPDNDRLVIKKPSKNRLLVKHKKEPKKTLGEFFQDMFDWGIASRDDEVNPDYVYEENAPSEEDESMSFGKEECKNEEPIQTRAAPAKKPTTIKKHKPIIVQDKKLEAKPVITEQPNPTPSAAPEAAPAPTTVPTTTPVPPAPTVTPAPAPMPAPAPSLTPVLPQENKEVTGQKTSKTKVYVPENSSFEDLDEIEDFTLEESKPSPNFSQKPAKPLINQIDYGNKDQMMKPDLN